MGDAGQDSLYGGTGNDYLHGVSTTTACTAMSETTPSVVVTGTTCSKVPRVTTFSMVERRRYALGEEGFDGLSGQRHETSTVAGRRHHSRWRGHDALAGGGAATLSWVVTATTPSTARGFGHAGRQQRGPNHHRQANEINETFTFYESWVDSG
ncbi:MAG: hypothetical protein CM1200mP2_56290 [Planctomycetaceae bacterium]|nr:MAG: hypothetical protein CM1200mP2_56290 [Planctomycetaceae bacterium]